MYYIYIIILFLFKSFFFINFALAVCIFYDIDSCSIYINNKAMLKPGKTIPVKGTKIDGKYDAVIIKL